MSFELSITILSLLLFPSSCSIVQTHVGKNCGDKVCVRTDTVQDNVEIMVTDSSGNILETKDIKLEVYCKLPQKTFRRAAHLGASHVIKSIKIDTKKDRWIFLKREIPNQCQFTFSVATKSSHDYFKFRDI